MHYSPTNLFFGCPGFQFLDVGAAGRGGAATCCGCLPGAASAILCRALRISLGLLLLPGPLLLGGAVAVAISLAWLPVGLTWAAAAALHRACRYRRPKQQHPPQHPPQQQEQQEQHEEEEDGDGEGRAPRRRPLVQCLGGGWEAVDMAFPLVACTRAFRQGNGWWGTSFVAYV